MYVYVYVYIYIYIHTNVYYIYIYIYIFIFILLFIAAICHKARALEGAVAGDLEKLAQVRPWYGMS